MIYIYMDKKEIRKLVQSHLVCIRVDKRKFKGKTINEIFNIMNVDNRILNRIESVVEMKNFKDVRLKNNQ